MVVALEELGKKVHLSFLSAFYGNLLTEKQRRALSLYCEEDLSLAEIAGEMGISRQAVHEAISRASSRMAEMESSLGLAARYRQMENGLEQLRLMIQHHDYDQAEKMIDSLLAWDQEDQNGL
ncbi:MAG: DNA-binding protein [Clostridiales bacterium]|nr:DNA-binding protein [Clostridiales bacterium]